MLGFSGPQTLPFKENQNPFILADLNNGYLHHKTILRLECFKKARPLQPLLGFDQFQNLHRHVNTGY